MGWHILASLKPIVSLKDLVTLGNHFKSIEDWNECALWLDAALRKWSELQPDQLSHSMMFSAQECFTHIGQFGYARYLGRFLSDFISIFRIPVIKTRLQSRNSSMTDSLKIKKWIFYMTKWSGLLARKLKLRTQMRQEKLISFKHLVAWSGTNINLSAKRNCNKKPCCHVKKKATWKWRFWVKVRILSGI